MSATTSTGTAGVRATWRPEATRAMARSALSGLSSLLLMIIVILAIWQGSIWVFNLNSFVVKSPADVFSIMFLADDAADNRALLMHNLAITLANSFIGFVAGLLVALIVAALFQLSRGIESALMPVAMLLRSVPLVAMAPVIILITGRETFAVAAIGGIVVLFPALVNIVFGLRSSSPQMNDLVTVYGGNRWTLLRKIALPSSLPSFFAAVRISVPGAITGALLAEWLATGSGIGSLVMTSYSQVKFGILWAAVVLVTLVSLVLYSAVLIVEKIVLARMGMHEKSA